MRKIISAFAVAASLGLLTIPAQARTDPAAGGLVVSESTVSPGQTVLVANQGATPGATVTITLLRSSSSALGKAFPVMVANQSLHRAAPTFGSLTQGTVTLGVTTANREGAFQASVTVPATTVSGIYTLIAVSNDSVLGMLILRVSAAADGVTGLPFTSSEIIPGLAVGTGLIVAGGLLLLSVKHRRSIV